MRVCVCVHVFACVPLRTAVLAEQEGSLILVLPGLVAGVKAGAHLGQLLPQLLVLPLQAAQGRHVAVPQRRQR